MNDKCQIIVFSNKAYNAIIRESFDKDPVETGGILLGHILNNGVWIVMEVLPPGIKCIFERSYFEYDDAFVNYLAQSVANQYKIPLELLGLWHRHPGSLDVFSSTDDRTNATFARQNPNGVISGLVNIDPYFRLTMYYMSNPDENTEIQYNRPPYKRIDFEVGNDIIPDEYFKLRYYDGNESDLNPIIERSHRYEPIQGNLTEDSRDENINENHGNVQQRIFTESRNDNSLWVDDLKKIWTLLKKHKILCLTALILLILSAFSIKTAINGCIKGTEIIISWLKKDDSHKPYISKDKITLNVGEKEFIKPMNMGKRKTPEWESSDSVIATINAYGKITAKKPGKVKMILSVDGKIIDVCFVEVIDSAPVSDYKLQNTELFLRVGQKHRLVLEGAKDTANILWSSEKKDIADVTDNGQVEAKQPGVSTIIATINGEQYKCTVNVGTDADDE